MSEPHVIITIDGPAGAGKSTIAKRLAKCLQCSYLDTGAMYRALTLKAIQQGVDLENENELATLARGTMIDLKDRDGDVTIFLDGKDVSEEIRSLEVTNKTFYIARAPKVRAILVQWQQKMGKEKSVVAEGRDTGTVVFPNASHKFYLDATFDERASRRLKELKEKGKDVDRQQLKQEIKERDAKDLARKVGPLKKAKDAIVIDSTGLSIEGVVEKILSYIQ